MRIKFFAQVMVFLFVSGLLFSGIFPQDEKEEVQEKIERKSLIKKDLLRLPERTLSPPKRNIFTRARAQMAADAFGQNEESPLPGERRIPGQPGQMDQPEQVESLNNEIRFDVKYIGYVKSGSRVVALIIFENEVYAVEAGDVIGVGLTIGDVTPDDMEIRAGGAEPQRIILEGEKP